MRRRRGEVKCYISLNGVGKAVLPFSVGGGGQEGGRIGKGGK